MSHSVDNDTLINVDSSKIVPITLMQYARYAERSPPSAGTFPFLRACRGGGRP
jgi:hypothetical protein